MIQNLAWQSFTGLVLALRGLIKLYRAWQSFMGVNNAAWQGEGKINKNVTNKHTNAPPL